MEQSQRLAKLLEYDAPKSYFVWIILENSGSICIPAYADQIHLANVVSILRAYTGEELGILLLNALPGGFFGKESMPPLVRGRTKLAIKGLEEGWIKKENFKYE